MTTDTHWQCGTINVASKTHGDPQNPWVIALHGWLDNAASFNALAPLLKDVYVIALDLPGHGHSDAMASPDHYTIARYAEQHSGPFRAALSDRSKTTHICRVAEGNFGAFVGWPNFTARLTGEFMGFPATGKIGEFRVIDVYRRAGDKLAENWVFIDLLHFWKTQGIDAFGALVDANSQKLIDSSE